MTEQAMPPPQSTEPPPKKSNAWKWGLGCGCVGLLLVPAGLFIPSLLLPAVRERLDRLYVEVAVTEAEANPDVAAALGLPIEADFGESGDGTRASAETGTSESWSLELVGPSGRAPLTLRADKGDWGNGEMLVELDGVTIDLVTDGY